MDGLLGDKLTAFAPNTTGIPYYKNEKSQSMEIIKQLYDIGCLFDEATNLPLISDTFQEFAKQELSYRGLEDDSGLVIQDIMQVSDGYSGDTDPHSGDVDPLVVLV